jgi:hypothetical protein
MRTIKFLTIIFLVFSTAIIAQTTYSGPATGSVSSGVMVNTDDFTFQPIDDGIPGKIKVMEIMKNDDESLNLNFDGPVLDNYVYVDAGPNSPSGVETGLNIVLHSFESIPPQGSTPPDPAMSVGPNHVITAINGRFHIYDREGNLLKNIDEDDWISEIIGTPVISDPQVIYDHHNGKWVMLWFTRNTPILEAPFVICHSDDENPLGIWYMYAIGSELNGGTFANNWGDYPKIGYDDQALYINSRQFGFTSGYQYNKIRILNSGYDTGGNIAYFAFARQTQAFTSFYQLFKISDPITNPDLTSVQVTATPYVRAPSGVQPSGDPVDNFSWISKAPVVRDGKLYGAHAIRNSQNNSYASLKYFIIDLNTNLIIEEVEQGEIGSYFITPAITVDLDHNIAITYSKCSSTDFIGAYYSTRLSNDPAGLSPSKVMKTGEGNYTSFSRWGDYFSAAIDPINQYDIWLYSEFAKTGTWGTWVTEIRMKPYQGAHTFASSNPVIFDNVEVGMTPVTETITIANYGEDDLVIDGITSPVGPFTLLTNLNFPVTISTFDSLAMDLEIQFDPTEPIVYEELMAFNDNDPGFDGLILKGRGYEINPAFTGLFYAVTSASDTGTTLTLDKTTGSGTELGASNFLIVNSLSIDPVSNIMYGTVSTNFESDLVRFNAAGGDAYTLYNFDLGSMVAIAFDTLGTLYAALQNGEIYTIDLSDGTYTPITSTIQLVSIAVDPTTNEMWASPRIVIGQKDKIYKIDLVTGDATLIGETGFDLVTNDLAFDELGTLYGVVGASPEISKLISIDKTDATGTEVGETGYEDIQGLAYTVTGDPSSIESENDGVIPEEYALSQNYPNPFNPTTHIEFSLPVNADVKLVVYNILGEQVTKLLNTEISAGNHSVVWNATDASGTKLTSGIYLYKLQANGKDGSVFQEIRKMVLLK